MKDKAMKTDSKAMSVKAEKALTELKKRHNGMYVLRTMYYVWNVWTKNELKAGSKK